MTFYHARDWGGFDLTIDLKKIDFLPRITLSQMTGRIFLNIGFLMLTFNLCLYDSKMQEFVKQEKEEWEKEKEKFKKDFENWRKTQRDAEQ